MYEFLTIFLYYSDIINLRFRINEFVYYWRVVNNIIIINKSKAISVTGLGGL
jgi:hypothetical protein